MKKKIYQISPNDYILAAIFVLAVIFQVVMLFNKGGHNQDSAKTAEIFMNNKLIYSVSLKQHKIFELKGLHIEVNAGRIRVFKANCPRNICVQSGWITGVNERIVCIPKKVLIEIIPVPGEEKNCQYDYILK